MLDTLHCLRQTWCVQYFENWICFCVMKYKEGKNPTQLGPLQRTVGINGLFLSNGTKYDPLNTIDHCGSRCKGWLGPPLTQVWSLCPLHLTTEMNCFQNVVHTKYPSDTGQRLTQYSTTVRNLQGITIFLTKVDIVVKNGCNTQLN
jgi:hypothetical protein